MKRILAAVLVLAVVSPEMSLNSDSARNGISTATCRQDAHARTHRVSFGGKDIIILDKDFCE